MIPTFAPCAWARTAPDVVRLVLDLKQAVAPPDFYAQARWRIQVPSGAGLVPACGARPAAGLANSGR